MRLLHEVAFSKKLRWLAQTKVITFKTQLHAVNACSKRLSQLSFSLVFGKLKMSRSTEGGGPSHCHQMTEGRGGGSKL